MRESEDSVYDIHQDCRAEKWADFHGDVSKRAHAAVFFLKIKTADDCRAQLVVSRTRIHPSFGAVVHTSALPIFVKFTQALIPEQALDQPQC